ncbi:DUF4157 domain-containing protein [Nostoc parmelioides]|uniref:DUF4157 domain-containing protein n=1 Tax=Nostoc parmelioides FACHB-3921 TaxID=2692909 RepID=A0ABR8BE55_9NOSO|nr:DUF4157 domain-containing protein [Nostoc parmelioides]MBD2251994.1 DUF4157 domain-containing protein [Nostoc parmelioides FACHB-3921]
MAAGKQARQHSEQDRQRNVTQTERTAERDGMSALFPGWQVMQSGQDDIPTEMQQTLGNRAVGELLKPKSHQRGQLPLVVQPKLTVGAAGDRYEQEADRIAAAVVEHIHSPAAATGDGQAVQRRLKEDELRMKPMTYLQREAMEEDDELQMKPLVQRVGAEGGEVSADFESEINRARGGGQPLATELQAKIGQAMGADFSRVRVHTDEQADALNRRVGARAFTTGQDLFFKWGEYQPGSWGGQELIAHELTHVVQQSSPYYIQRVLYVGRATKEPVSEKELEKVTASIHPYRESKLKQLADDDKPHKFATWDDVINDIPIKRYRTYLEYIEDECLAELNKAWGEDYKTWRQAETMTLALKGYLTADELSQFYQWQGKVNTMKSMPYAHAVYERPVSAIAKPPVSAKAVVVDDDEPELGIDREEKPSSEIIGSRAEKPLVAARAVVVDDEPELGIDREEKPSLEVIGSRAEKPVVASGETYGSTKPTNIEKMKRYGKELWTGLMWINDTVSAVGAWLKSEGEGMVERIGDPLPEIVNIASNILGFVDLLRGIKMLYSLVSRIRLCMEFRKQSTYSDEAVKIGGMTSEYAETLRYSSKKILRSILSMTAKTLTLLSSGVSRIVTIATGGITGVAEAVLKTIGNVRSIVEVGFRSIKAYYKRIKGTKGVNRGKKAKQILEEAGQGSLYAATIIQKMNLPSPQDFQTIYKDKVELKLQESDPGYKDSIYERHAILLFLHHIKYTRTRTPQEVIEVIKNQYMDKKEDVKQRIESMIAYELRSFV